MRQQQKQKGARDGQGRGRGFNVEWDEGAGLWQAEETLEIVAVGPFRAWS